VLRLSPTDIALFIDPNPTIEIVDLIGFVDPKVNNPVKEKVKVGEAMMEA